MSLVPYIRSQIKEPVGPTTDNHNPSKSCCIESVPTTRIMINHIVYGTSPKCFFFMQPFTLLIKENQFGINLIFCSHHEYSGHISHTLINPTHGGCRWPNIISINRYYSNISWMVKRKQIFSTNHNFLRLYPICYE